MKELSQNLGADLSKKKTEKIVSRLFDFFMAQYNFRWKETSDLVSQEIMLKTWRNAIDGLSDEQLKYGYNQISKGLCYVEFPPTAGQFRNLCKSLPDENRFTSAQSQESKKIINQEKTNKLEKDRLWFSKLTDNGKMIVWDSAVKAQPTFEDIFNHTGLSILSPGFEYDPWFAAVMDAFKSYNRLG